MKRNEFTILNRLYNLANGRPVKFADIYLNKCLMDDEALDNLVAMGYVDGHFETITKAGIAALEPYRVKNAVILAAGASTRFVPISLEQPKGLFEVRGEKLIERQIKQLLEAGIKDITVVLGYKKEMFFFLKEKYNVHFIFNSSYNIKNNIESVYLAKESLGNTYICSCDNYFLENPFNEFEYDSFYAGLRTRKKINEIYVELDENKRILEMKKGMLGGTIVLGHSYWKQDFCEGFIKLAEDDKEYGLYNDVFWEWLVNDNLDKLPPFYFKEYLPNSIYEFDYFDELRKFDSSYIKNTHSKIVHNIKKVFQCEDADIRDFRKINEGMTNTSFIFKLGDVDYIYRHPGDGTEKIINRNNEKTTLEQAKAWGIDPTYVFMDVEEGWKISVFVPEFREPDYGSFEDSKKVLAVLRKLHRMKSSVTYGMRPWEDAVAMENLLLKKDPNCFKDFLSLKAKIQWLYEKTIGDGVEKCFCHGDTYKPNWMLKPNGDVILIDWEYSGISDPGIDVGYYIVDAMYDFPEALRFIREYLGKEADETKEFHFMAYTAIIAYYWFVWALYRESCGAVMGEALFNWYEMAKKYADYLVKK